MAASENVSCRLRCAFVLQTRSCRGRTRPVATQASEVLRHGCTSSLLDSGVRQVSAWCRSNLPDPRSESRTAFTQQCRFEGLRCEAGASRQRYRPEGVRSCRLRGGSDLTCPYCTMPRTSSRTGDQQPRWRPRSAKSRRFVRALGSAICTPLGGLARESEHGSPGSNRGSSSSIRPRGQNAVWSYAPDKAPFTRRAP